jgi:hypothetical protein
VRRLPRQLIILAALLVALTVASTAAARYTPILNGIACPSVKLCVAVNHAGNIGEQAVVAASRHPGSGTAVWKIVRLGRDSDRVSDRRAALRWDRLHDRGLRARRQQR